MTPEEVLRQCGLSDPAAELAGFLRRQRWFSGRDRDLQAVEIVDAGNDGGDPAVVPVLVDAVYGDGGRERYSVPLSIRSAERGIVTDVGLVATGSGRPSERELTGVNGVALMVNRLTNGGLRKAIELAIMFGTKLIP